MPMLDLGPEDAIYYDWTPPAEGKASFVFVNPISGDTGLWTGVILPALKTKGLGALVYDFRGQTQSAYKPGTALTADLIVDDLKRIVDHVAPPKPILAGLSIGPRSQRIIRPRATHPPRPG